MERRGDGGDGADDGEEKLRSSVSKRLGWVLFDGAFGNRDVEVMGKDVRIYGWAGLGVCVCVNKPGDVNESIVSGQL